MRVGVTGSRFDPAPVQAGRLGIELCRFKMDADAELDHGDCTGSDALAHELGAHLGYRLHVHPPTVDTYRAFKWGHVNYDPQSYAARDAAIVHRVGRLLALPRAAERDPLSLRSGTWLTIRLARRKGIPISIIWPDGSVTSDGG